LRERPRRWRKEGTLGKRRSVFIQIRPNEEERGKEEGKKKSAANWVVGVPFRPSPHEEREKGKKKGLALDDARGCRPKKRKREGKRDSKPLMMLIFDSMTSPDSLPRSQGGGGGEREKKAVKPEEKRRERGQPGKAPLPARWKEQGGRCKKKKKKKKRAPVERPTSTWPLMDQRSPTFEGKEGKFFISGTDPRGERERGGRSFAAQAVDRFAISKERTGRKASQPAG